MSFAKKQTTLLPEVIFGKSHTTIVCSFDEFDCSGRKKPPMVWMDLNGKEADA